MGLKMRAALAAVATLGTAVHAQQPDSASPATRGWQFTVEPYFMLPNMDGRSAIGPFDVRVSSSPADIFSNLNWGVMGLVELNNGHVGIAFDGTYMNLESERDARIDRVGGHQGAYSITALVRIERHAEAYAGIRVNDLGVRLSGTGPLGNARAASRSETWVDPIVGMRINLPFSRNTDLTVLTDVGGFGMASDITVQAWPSLGFRISDTVRAKLGYRLIYTKYESGAGINRFVYDVLTYGPTLGVRFQF